MRDGKHTGLFEKLFRSNTPFFAIRSMQGVLAFLLPIELIASPLIWSQITNIILGGFSLDLPFMIKGKNDTQKHLEEIKKLLSGTGVRVNLLPYHPTGTDGDCSSDNATMMRFKHILVTSGVGASVRKSRGEDIEAACGMLAARITKQT